MRKIKMYKLLLLTLLASPVFAETKVKYNPYMRLKHFSLDISRMTGNKELMLPEIPGNEWNARIATNFDVEFFKYIFWRNQVHGEAAYAKFYSVGWRYDLGFQLGKQIQIFWHHHSRHTMDVDLPYYYNRITEEFEQIDYPVEDSVVLRLIFVNR